MSTLASCRVVLLCAFFVGIVSLREATAQEGADSPDHPIGVVAAASVDRLLDQAVQLMQIHEVASTREEVVVAFKQTLQMIDFNSEIPAPWLDSTKPIGLMLFYDGNFWVPAEASPDGKPAVNEDAEARGGILGLISEIGVTPNHVIAFFPVKDYQQMLASGNLTPVAGKANCFRDDRGLEQYLRRFGPYVVMGLGEDTINHCPDPRDLLRSVLGKNDLAVSLQLKGLPPLLRSLGAEGIKSVYEAGLQRRDDEQDRDYRLRRALGDIARELLDLAMTQVDEVTLGIRLDAELRSCFDLEVIGTNDGKLAKCAAEMTPKKSAFDPLWNADYDQSLGIALALPTRHTKPLAAAIRNHVATATDAGEIKAFKENAAMFNASCRILDSNHFELVWTGERDGDTNISLLGIKLPTNREFPQEFEGWIKSAASDSESLTTLSLEGMPVYRFKTIPFLGDYPAKFSESIMEVGSYDEDTKSVSWVLATPDALWLCSREGLSEDPIPSLLYRAYDVKTLAADGARNRRSVAPFRMSLHPRLWTTKNAEPDHSDTTVDREPDPDREQNLTQQAKRQEIYDAHPDTISVELLPTSRGLKLSLSFDTVYAVVVPHLIKETILGITHIETTHEWRVVQAR